MEEMLDMEVGKRYTYEEMAENNWGFLFINDRYKHLINHDVDIVSFIVVYHEIDQSLLYKFDYKLIYKSGWYYTFVPVKKKKPGKK